MTLVRFSALLGDAVLGCPCCGGDYLHQEKVEVFQRHKEDAPSVGVTFDGGIPQLDTSGRNPSARRQGLLLYFSCEDCGRLQVALAIAQHKGNTWIEWVQP